MPWPRAVFYFKFPQKIGGELNSTPKIWQSTSEYLRQIIVPLLLLSNSTDADLWADVFVGSIQPKADSKLAYFLFWKDHVSANGGRFSRFLVSELICKRKEHFMNIDYVGLSLDHR